MFRFLTIAWVTFLIAASAAAAQEKEPGKKPSGELPDQAALERKFEKQMRNVTLVGHFTVDGEKTDKLKEERYTITKVTKVEGETWIFQARIQYGDHDVSLPLPLTVRWAGDTPVVTVTDVGIPFLGTYTARVVFYGDKYAGTWNGKDHGGHLFGKIERMEKVAPTEKKQSPAK
jgi:hypothetical protein